MRAILYNVDGEERLRVGECHDFAIDGEPAPGDGESASIEGDPDAVDAGAGAGQDDVAASTDIDVDPGEVFAFLEESPVGLAPAPTIEEVTNRLDPWLAWYGGTDDVIHVVLYGSRGRDDRRVSFAEADDEYQVRLVFGTVADVPDREFESNDGTSVVVRTGSRLYAKRLFYDFCDVT